MDICMYISDQHSFEVQGYAGNTIVRSPNLDRIAAEGTAFMNNYCAYPVCVPSRMSLLAGQYCSKINVMSNSGSLSSNVPTFLHSLDIAGYETVLCGRMHFVGADQRHGFTKRIAGDITQIYNNRPERIATERGVHNKTLQGGPSSVSLIGGGNSPSLEYDRYVVEKAVEYLSGSYDKPQFISVGTYAPHHPFVSPKELFEYYYDKVSVPSDSFKYPEHPALNLNFRDESEEIVRAVRAAYYGMVEFEDKNIGRVYDAFQDYLKRNGREGIFLYVSDHGEHEGYRGQYGKNTFYECSAHVPMLWAGKGIQKNVRKRGYTSLLDIGPTIIDLCNSTKLPYCDGRSLKKQLESEYDDLERVVCSEVGGNITLNRFSYGQMAISNGLKYIHYAGYDKDDIIYDLNEDPYESENVIDRHHEELSKFKDELRKQLTVSLEDIRKQAEIEKNNVRILRMCDFDSEELWHCTPAARSEPEPCFRSKKTVETWKNEIKKKI